MLVTAVGAGRFPPSCLATGNPSAVILLACSRYHQHCLHMSHALSRDPTHDDATQPILQWQTSPPACYWALSDETNAGVKAGVTFGRSNCCASTTGHINVCQKETTAGNVSKENHGPRFFLHERLQISCSGRLR